CVTHSLVLISTLSNVFLGFTSASSSLILYYVLSYFPVFCYSVSALPRTLAMSPCVVRAIRGAIYIAFYSFIHILKHQLHRSRSDFAHMHRKNICNPFLPFHLTSSFCIPNTTFSPACTLITVGL
ncbi:hypothetical protein BDZ97DRAFT_1825141, partial [Flammula alnicola]